MITVSVDVYRLAPYVPCVELVFLFIALVVDDTSLSSDRNSGQHW